MWEMIRSAEEAMRILVDRAQCGCHPTSLDLFLATSLFSFLSFQTSAEQLVFDVDRLFLHSLAESLVPTHSLFS
jgi:hypothetical protein